MSQTWPDELNLSQDERRAFYAFQGQRRIQDIAAEVYLRAQFEGKTGGKIK